MSEHTGVPPVLPPAFHCANHPAREGVGVCVACRSVVCVECSTRVDGMNYCIRCLQRAAPTAPAPSGWSAPALRLPLLIGSFLAALFVFAGFGLLLAKLR